MKLYRLKSHFNFGFNISETMLSSIYVCVIKLFLSVTQLNIQFSCGNLPYFCATHMEYYFAYIEHKLLVCSMQ